MPPDVVYKYVWVTIDMGKEFYPYIMILNL